MFRHFYTGKPRSGPVDGTPAPGGVSISHPSDRFEQEAEQIQDLYLDGKKDEAAATLSDDFIDLVSLADRRLYEAKAAGRNCVRP